MTRSRCALTWHSPVQTEENCEKKNSEYPACSWYSNRCESWLQWLNLASSHTAGVSWIRCRKLRYGGQVTGYG